MVYDTIYAPRGRLCCGRGRSRRAGRERLSMLLHQGALAFENWFDRAAPLEAMRAALL